jgi:hypothetical protein
MPVYDCAAVSRLPSHAPDIFDLPPRAMQGWDRWDRWDTFSCSHSYARAYVGRSTGISVPSVPLRSELIPRLPVLPLARRVGRPNLYAYKTAFLVAPRRVLHSFKPKPLHRLGEPLCSPWLFAICHGVFSPAFKERGQGIALVFALVAALVNPLPQNILFTEV